ncbi:unnamed protein product [Closterium sp. NIES-53]
MRQSRDETLSLLSRPPALKPSCSHALHPPLPPTSPPSGKTIELDDVVFHHGKTIELDDVVFHQCVNLARFNTEKTVSFVPPDGEFELMKYRITEGINLPFRVLPMIKELGRTRFEVNVKVKSVFGAKMFALNVIVKVPVPKHTAKASLSVTSGRAKYNAAVDAIVWKIKKFPGQTELSMSAEVELISTMVDKKQGTRPPIQMEFQVPMFTASGLRVRFLKVWEKSGYSTVEWVRYITRAGAYEIRC